MEKFEVTSVTEGEIRILKTRGFLDAHTAPNFENALSKAVQEGCTKIVVDLEGLQYISSAGLGVFMGFIEDLRSQGGDIKICNASPKVYRIFDLLGFPSLFEFTRTTEEAIAKFKGEQGNKDDAKTI